MRTCSLVLSMLGAVLFNTASVQATKNQGTFSSFEELCMYNNFMSESYSVVTDDGYILQLYRIPGKFTEASSTQQKPAVLLQHGIESDMTPWVYSRPEVAPAFVLAEQGYDVWLGNNRGTRYSRGHVNPAISPAAYWDFYQEDMARQDVPTFIDHILDTTGLDNLTYLGHSEGTTQFFMGASLMPEYYSQKVNLMVALAPIADLAHMEIGIAHWAAKFTSVLAFVVSDVLHAYNLVPPHPIVNEAIVFGCKMPELKKFCIGHAQGPYGVNDPYAKKMGIAHSMAGAGWKTWIYYAQIIRDMEGFRLYNYGYRQNKKIYGQAETPAVPLENYNIPTALISGTADVLANTVDVAWLTGALGENVVMTKIMDNFDHMSFFTAKDMSYFNEVVDLVQQYNPTTAPDASLQ